MDMLDLLKRPEGWTLELKCIARAGTYGGQAMPELDSEAYDFQAASESFAPVRRFRGLGVRGDW